MVAVFAMVDIAAKIQNVAISLVPLLLGIVCHEVAHGYVAFRYGDPTAKMAGRLTLNPIKHLDPMGVIVFLITAWSGFAFGWAKPVPVDSRYFKDPRKTMMLVAVAGPVTNFMLAILFALLFRTLAPMVLNSTGGMTESVLYPLALIAKYGVIINVLLGVFNLMPIPPMDGSKVLAGFMPHEAGARYLSIGRYGFFIVLLLIATGLFSRVIGPPVMYISSILLNF